MTLNQTKTQSNMPEGKRNISDGTKRWTVLKVCTGRKPDPISILCVCVVLQRCSVFYRSLFPTCSHFLSWLLSLAPLCRWGRFLTDHTAVLGFAVYFCDRPAHTSQMGQTISEKIGLAIHLKMLLSYSPTPNIILSQECIHPPLTGERVSNGRDFKVPESHNLWSSSSH